MCRPARTRLPACLPLFSNLPTQSQARPAVEVPLDTSVHWKGHRFMLTSGIVQRSNALEPTRRNARAFYGDGDLSVSMKRGEIVVRRHDEGDGLLAEGPAMRWPTSHLESTFDTTRCAYAKTSTSSAFEAYYYCTYVRT